MDKIVNKIITETVKGVDVEKLEITPAKITLAKEDITKTKNVALNAIKMQQKIIDVQTIAMTVQQAIVDKCNEQLAMFSK